MKSMDSELRKIQNCQLDMALEVKRICNEHKLRYFLAYGSMLGAVRHGGFIPWDDDLDIAMPREDYDEFIKICEQELDEDYQVITWYSDKGYAGMYAKIMIKGTTYAEHEMRNVDSTKGIFIDVFPYDNYPNGENKFLLKRIKILRFLLCCKCKYAFDNYSTFYKMLGRISEFFLLPVNKKLICDALEKLERKYNNVSCDRMIGYNAGSKGKDWIYSKDINELIEVEVEGYKLNIIKNYDEFLSHYYGDYMTPPPEDKRENRHGIEKIDFAGYKIRNPIKGSEI